MLRAAALAVALVVALPVMATTREERALNNVQHEMSTCVAFYTFMRGCVAQRDPTLTATTDQIIQRLTVSKASVGQSIGMTLDAMRSRSQMELDNMTALTNNSCTNVSSLMHRHLNRCRMVVENPDSIFLEYLNRR